MPHVPDDCDLFIDDFVPYRREARGDAVADKLLAALRAHSEDRLGSCFEQGTLYWLCPYKHTGRRADVSFVRRGRLEDEMEPEEGLDLAPDFVAEVIAMHDFVSDVDQKIEDFFAAGTRLLWVINPILGIVLVLRPDGSAARLRDGQELDGEDVIPGFRMPVSSLWPESR
jgi:Uma2 family endonuclease